MKKILVAVLAVVLAVGCICAFTACNGGTKEDTIYVYTNAGFAPYEYINDKNEIVGVDIDIMNAIGAELGYKIVINDVKFPTILNYVKENKMAIGAAGMTQKPDRDAVAAASITYATSVQYVILPATTTIQPDPITGKVSMAQLAGMKIGTQEGTTGYYLVSDAVDGTTEDDTFTPGSLTGTNASYVEYTNAIIASGDIGSSLNAVVIDKLPARAITEGSSELVCYELDEEPESYVLYLNKDATELSAKVNEVLAKMIANGTIDTYTINHSTGK